MLNQETFLLSIGRSAKAKAGTGSTRMEMAVDELPPFLAAKNLKPFIDEDLRRSTKPIPYRTSTGGRAFGYLATVLPAVCKVYIDADNAGVLGKKQRHVAMACRALYESLADVAIIALVDDATGYQRKRPRLALEQYLATFLSKRLAAWSRRFPEVFYRACAAFFAISLRCCFVSFFARATPPFLPPSRPRATAAGFFSLLAVDSGVTAGVSAC